jgi:hypothetical protein
LQEASYQSPEARSQSPDADQPFLKRNTVFIQPNGVFLYRSNLTEQNRSTLSKQKQNIMKTILFFSLIFSALQLNAQNVSGTLDPDFTNPTLLNSVACITQQADGKIIIGQGGGQPLKRINLDGTSDNTFVAPTISTEQVIAHPNGKIYGFGGYARRFTATGADDNAPNAFTFQGGTARAAALMSDGSMIVVGNFTGVSTLGNTINRIAKVNANLELQTSFYYPSTGFDATVNTVTVDTVNNKIYCGGNFTTYNGTTVNRICRLNADGTLDATFDAGDEFGASGEQIYCIKILADGRIFVAGNLTTFAGEAENGCVILSASGERDLTFNITSTGYSNIKDAVQLPNGKIVVVGSAAFGNRLALINLDGSLDTYNISAFGNFADLGIDRIIIPSPGKILYGGWFTTVLGEDRNNLAQLLICDMDINNVLSFDGTSISAGDVIPGASYQWLLYNPSSESNTPISGATNPTFEPTENGYYSVEITIGNCYRLTNNININNLSLETASGLNAITIYPNPASSQVTFANVSNDTEVKIIDLTGKMLVRSQAPSNNGSFTMNVDNLPSGIYFVEFSNQGLTTQQKLIINR